MRLRQLNVLLYSNHGSYLPRAAKTGRFSMRYIGIAVFTALLWLLGACGSPSQARGINGPWVGALNNPDGTVAFAFSMSLTQSDGTAVNVTNFSFGSASCFSQASETATFNATGSSNGIVTGSFSLSASTEFPGVLNNMLTMRGDRSAATGDISGTWTLTGQPGCTGDGSFSMHLPPPV
jgi:hypothetical protein